MGSFILSAPGYAFLLYFARSLRDVFVTLLLRTLLYFSRCFSVVNKYIVQELFTFNSLEGHQDGALSFFPSVVNYIYFVCIFCVHFSFPSVVNYIYFVCIFYVHFSFP